LILAHNLHGIDIDLRCAQIAALALWLRCQRAYQEMGLKKDHPKITRSNFVCAEPMPGEEQMLKEFVSQLEPKFLGQVVEVVFQKMKLAGEAGSLLKIEEEIRDAVAAAKKQWLRDATQAVDRKGQPLLFTQVELDRIAGKTVQPSLFDLSGITDGQFFERAEAEVVEALGQYAEKAQNGRQLQRKLFAEDAARGFAFVDICQKRYDVALMNPPFGESSISTFDYFETRYPDWAENLACASVNRGRSCLTTEGLLGAFCDRTVSIKSSYEVFRRNDLIGKIVANCDTGWGVLDANVETTAFVLTAKVNAPSGLYLNAATQQISEQPSWIASAVSSGTAGVLLPDCYFCPSSDFEKLPNSVIGYYFPTFLVSLFNIWPSLSEAGFQARQGHSVVKGQHARVFWEIPTTAKTGKDLDYAAMYNGGEYSLFWVPLREVTRYGRDANFLAKNPAVALRNQQHQFQAGIGYGKRGEILDAHIIPSGVVFSDEGQGITGIKLPDAWTILAFLNSSLAQFSINQYCGQHKHCGYINLLPIPKFSEPLRAEITQRCKSIVDLKRKWYSLDETSLEFTGKTIVLKKGHTHSLHQSVLEACRAYQADEAALSKMIEANDEQFAKLACSGDRSILRAFEANRPPSQLRTDLSPTVATGRFSSFLIEDFVSWSIGSVFGRWDVRLAIEHDEPIDCSEPFAPLPAYPPGTLKGSDGLPQANAPSGYPLRINANGILVDDPDHKDDVVRRVREVFETIWKNEAESIEKEACEILGVRVLRDYFRKPGNGAFWDDHISRYSKSRRKAPIYWLLQSSNRNYALWLYYHRLDKDLLFKALVNYVEPKLRLETNRLETLRSQKAAAGESGKEAKRLAKDIESQEDFLSELRDFEDKLRRTANLHLQPDLNDGVILNIASLHELVPWKEAEEYWEELIKGEYEWSSISKQLRQKGLVK
jgi:hypothetical protein